MDCTELAMDYGDLLRGLYNQLVNFPRLSDHHFYKNSEDMIVA